MSKKNSFLDKILLWVFKILGNSSLKRVIEDTKKADRLQNIIFNKIIKSQLKTEYGKKYNFKDISSTEDFKKQHPITTYEDYRPIIEEIANTGDYNKLVGEAINFFQETSGTTGKSKLIPRTKTSFSLISKYLQAAIRLAQSYYLDKEQNPPYIGLTMTNSLPLKQTPSGIPRGTGTSGGWRQSKFFQKIVSLNFCSPLAVFLIPDCQSSYYCHLLFALLNDNLVYISANFASNVLEGMQILEDNWQQMIQDIEKGRVSENLKLDIDTRNELNKYLTPNSKRAEELKVEFEKGFINVIPRIWKKLTYIQCNTTGSLEIYANNLKKYTGDIPFFSTGYGASEAWIGINLEPERKENPEYTLTPATAFFEFIPIAEIDKDQPPTVNLSSLSPGESYEVMVTTIAGLYRYRMGDIVECTRYYNATPVIKFLYRRGSLLNINGEKISEKLMFRAINEALKKIEKSKLIEYSTSIDLKSYPFRYLIYIETTNQLLIKDCLTSIEETIDLFLSKENETYSDFRKSNSISSPQVVLVQNGSFKKLKEEIISSNGVAESQFKMPRLLKNSEYIERLNNH